MGWNEFVRAESGFFPVKAAAVVIFFVVVASGFAIAGLWDVAWVALALALGANTILIGYFLWVAYLTVRYRGR